MPVDIGYSGLKGRKNNGVEIFGEGVRG